MRFAKWFFNIIDLEFNHDIISKELKWKKNGNGNSDLHKMIWNKGLISIKETMHLLISLHAYKPETFTFF